MTSHNVTFYGTDLTPLKVCNGQIERSMVSLVSAFPTPESPAAPEPMTVEPRDNTQQEAS